MNRFVPGIAVTVVATAALAAAQAGASPDSHFDVVAKVKDSHSVPGGFGFREKLLDPDHPVDKVGFDRGVCKLLSGPRIHCRVVFHLGGELGGSGTLRASGVFGPSDHRISINGGSGDFEGAAGNVVLAGAPGRGQLLSFSVR